MNLNKFKFLLILVFIIFVVIISYNIEFSSNNKIKIDLIKCVDGDTAWFNINGTEEKVRFLGIDTRESTTYIETYGESASNYTCELLTSSNDIYIEYDNNSEKRDKYNRVLGWVFIDDNNLSELLVSNGYAEVKYIYGDYKYVDDLCALQYKAYEDKVGIWSLNDNDNDYKNNYCFKNN